MRAPKLTYVVEDNPITSTITELIVRKELHCGQVQKYANGKRALDQLTTVLEEGKQVPDLILLDLNMPLMDGWEFLDAFVDLPLDTTVCVFILTSSIHPDDIAKAKHYKEVRGYFSKPLEKGNVSQMQRLFEAATD